MVLLVLLVLALFVLQTLLPGRFREPAADGAKGKLTENLGNRDHMRPLTVVGERATRALENMHEALPVFLALALLNMIVGTAASTAITGATMFLIARVAVRRHLHGGRAGRAHTHLGGELGRPRDDDRPAAPEDLSDKEKPPAFMGPEASLPLVTWVLAAWTDQASGGGASASSSVRAAACGLLSSAWCRADGSL